MESPKGTIQIPTGTWQAISPDSLRDGKSAAVSHHRVRIWALVLEARQIPFHIEPSAHGWSLLVPKDKVAAALKELHLYENENRNWPPKPEPEAPLSQNTLSTLSVLILLATFHNLTLLDLHLFGHAPVNWLELGNADAAKILSGQWWRTATALTLHADGVHLLGNLAIGGLFITRLCHRLGSGLAWTLILASGVLGNALNALLQHPDHRAVGASTAVFGTVGVLAAISMVRFRRPLWKRWPLPIAAALALLALLGTTGERTDIGAHLWGFVWGLILGGATAKSIQHYGPPGARFNFILSLSTLCLMVLAWGLALR